MRRQLLLVSTALIVVSCSSGKASLPPPGSALAEPPRDGASEPTAAPATGGQQAPQDIRDLPETRWYAQQYGVSLDEAVRRGLLQEEAHDLKRQLREAAKDRFFAVWLQHEPNFRVVAWYTGAADTLQAPLLIAQSSKAIPVEVRGGAPFTEAESEELLQRIHASLPVDIDAAGMGVDGPTGRIHLELQPTSRYASNAAAMERDLTARFGVEITVGTSAEEAGDD